MAQDTARRIALTIAGEIGARGDQVASAVALLDEGATVPFIARYRKEVTGGLDDTQLRTLADRLGYLRELEARRASILKEIGEQGKLTPQLETSIVAAETKATLEDIYLPYKPKRRTRATIAREAGLQPLVDALFADRNADPETLAERYKSETFAEAKDVLNGARDIVAEGLGENAVLLGKLRSYMQSAAVLTSTVISGQEEKGAKFSDYFGHVEKWANVPSHRALAMLRASNEGVVSLDIAPPVEVGSEEAEAMIRGALGIHSKGAADLWLAKVAGWTWRTKLSLTMMLDLMTDMRKRAQEEAIAVFALNLKDLLLAAPAGARATIGLDPGIRTGVKVAVVDATGKLLDAATVYPFQPKMDLRGAQATIGALIKRHNVELIAIGNGTASRETEKMVTDLLADIPAPKPTKVIVSEAGASVYSASELAAREFPDLDVSLRGAVSIARRLQDPLAELVKIEPKSIGVGQYQHDVDQFRLGKSLEAVVEDAVNAVGVDLNMASAPLLAQVSGLGQSLAEAIVEYRNTNGAFATRKDLLSVPRLGPRAFEQAAGFLRIADGSEPLDASSVHPEAYDVARKIVAACGRDLREVMKDPKLLARLAPEEFVTDKFGLPTVQDIFAELEKPGRDPRPSFKTATFTDGVEDIKDLKVGMSLEGTVTNVAAFGAFVDIGVHQDGLVHVSQLADRFVKDPHEVVKAGDVVRVRVTEVDVPRKRIGLTMRKDGGGEKAPRQDRDKPQRSNGPRAAAPQKKSADTTGSFGSALLDAMKKR